MNMPANTNPHAASTRQLAIAYGSFLNLGWTPQWAGPERLVGFSETAGGKAVDMIIIVAGNEAPALYCGLPDGSSVPEEKQLEKNRQFEPVFRQLHNSTTEDQLREWIDALAALSAQTETAIANQERQEKELSRAMPFASKAPYLTYSLMAINILVFILMAISGVGPFEPSTEGLIRWGANYAPYTLSGEGWRLATCFFLHAGIFHVVLNMIALFQVGSFLEHMLGRWRLAAVYTISGLCASVASLWWHTDPVASVGASGAVFGLFGCFTVLLLFQVMPRSIGGPLLKNMAIIIFLNLLNGLKSGIDNSAHVGGLLAGALCALALIPSLRKSRVRAFDYGSALTLVACFALCGWYLQKNHSDDLAFQAAEHKLSGYETHGLAAFDSEVTDSVFYQKLVLAAPSWDSAVAVMQHSETYKLSPYYQRRRTLLLDYALARRGQNRLGRRQLEGAGNTADSMAHFNAELTRTLAGLKE